MYIFLFIKADISTNNAQPAENKYAITPFPKMLKYSHCKKTAKGQHLGYELKFMR